MDMKKNLNLTYFILCCLIALALLQAGCGKSGPADSPAASGSGKNPSASQTEPVELVMGYHPSPLALPEGLGAARYMALGGDTLFVSGQTADGAPTLYAMDLAGESWQELSYDAADGAASRIVGLAATESRLFVLATGAWDTEAMFTTLATAYDAQTLQAIGRFELKEFAQGGPAGVAAVGESLLCNTPYEMIYLYSDQGQLLNQIRPDGVLQCVSVLEGRVIVCLYHKDGSYGLWELDTGSGQLSNRWTSPESGGIPPTVPCISADGWFLADLTTVYDFDPDTGVMNPLFDWLDYGFSGLLIRDVARSAGGEIYTVSDGKVLVLRAYEGPARKELTVGSTGFGPDMEAAIANFNMQNEEYVARLTLYSWEQAELLLTEIAAGKGPDIVIWDQDGPLSAITADGGVFTDLMPYIDADPDISREDFLPMALEAMAPDGQLYLLSPSLTAWDLNIEASVYNSLPAWDIDALFQLAQDSRADHTLFSFFGKDQFLDYLCLLSSVRYVDFSSASCSFEDPSFARYLELANSIHYYQYPVTEGFFLATSSLDGFDAISMNAMSTTGRRIVGFPTDGEPVHMFTSTGGYGVLAYSPNKDGAWELLRQMLMPEYQAHMSCTPVMKDYVRDAMLNFASDHYEQLVRTNENAPVWSEWSKPVEQNIEQIMAAIENGVVARSSAIDDIIKEEANRYFNGQKPLSEAVASIQSRASVFLAEQYS